MDFSSLWSILAPGLFGAASGGFIDFCLGKSYQKKLKERLETAWLTFNFVKLTDFGRREALFAADVLQAMFGTFTSLRRLVSVTSAGLIVVTIQLSALLARHYASLGNIGVTGLYADIISFALSLVLMSISISITIAIARLAARIAGENVALNMAVFLFLVIAQYVLICFWPYVLMVALSPVDMLGALMQERRLNEAFNALPSDFIGVATRSVGMVESVWPKIMSPKFQLDALRRNFDVPLFGGNVWLTFEVKSTTVVLSMIVNIFRLLLATLFVFISALQPMRPVILLLGLRTLESEKPVITLIGIGLGYIGTAIQAIAKALFG